MVGKRQEKSMCNEWDKDIKESLGSVSNTINKEKCYVLFI